MAGMRNLNDGDFKDLKRRISALETSTWLASASVSRGRLRFYDDSILLIENGALEVTGSATITGTLNSNGVFNGSGINNLDGVNNLDGENHFTGPTDVAGDFEIIAGGLFKAGESVIRPDGSATFGLFDIAANGDLKSKGALSIEGPTDLKNDLTVQQGKKITLGGMVLENQSPGSAQIQLPGGGISASNDFGLSFVHDQVTISGNGDVLTESLTKIRLKAGASTVQVTPGGINLLNVPVATAGKAANVHIDADGKLWRANP